MKCSVQSDPIVAHENTQVFSTWLLENKLFKGCFMNEQQPNLSEHKDCSGWQRSKTRPQWLMWPSIQHIGKDIRASSLLFSRRAADVISEAYLIVMTGDRHDELAALDLSMTPSWLVWVLTVTPVWLNFSSFLFCSVLFLNTELYTLHEC